jgi:flagellar basal body-associated protein FliL
VAIPVLIAPVVEGGRLVGYIYLGLKVTAHEENAADRMRDQLPLLQDQILRAFNNAPIPAAEADSDEAKAALVKTATAALAGLKEAEGVETVELTDAQNVPF